VVKDGFPVAGTPDIDLDHPIAMVDGGLDGVVTVFQTAGVGDAATVGDEVEAGRYGGPREGRAGWR